MTFFDTEYYHDIVDDNIDAEVDSFYDEYLTDYVEENVYEEMCRANASRPRKGRKRAFKSKLLKEREDPFEKDDLEFYKTHRFSKSSVRKLTKLLFPAKKKNNRGLPFDPEQVVCTALKHLGGVSFKHLYKKGTKATGMRHYYAFISAVNKLEDEYIKMPSVDDMALSIRSLWEKYHLLNFIGTLGSTRIYLPHKPRALSEGDLMKNYKAKSDDTKNTRYAFNINMASGQDNTIYYATISPAGQPIPSWEEGESKTYLESLSPPVHLLGEPDQFLSNTICTPFSRWESTQDQRKALFNLRHSMARSEMTHRTIQLWMKRFPRLNNPNYRINIIKQTIKATLILHNISVLWSDPLPPEILASSPLLEPLHTVHEDIPQKYFTETSIQTREQILSNCLQGQMSQDEKQVLDLTTPVQVVHPISQQQQEYHQQLQHREYYQPPQGNLLVHDHQPENYQIYKPRAIYTTIPIPPTQQDAIQDLG